MKKFLSIILAIGLQSAAYAETKNVPSACYKEGVTGLVFTKALKNVNALVQESDVASACASMSPISASSFYKRGTNPVLCYAVFNPVHNPVLVPCEKVENLVRKT